jgi:hypothetical protein
MVLVQRVFFMSGDLVYFIIFTYSYEFIVMYFLYLYRVKIPCENPRGAPF